MFTNLIVVNISVMYQSQIIMLIHLKLIQCYLSVVSDSLPAREL